jgi:hypothetical protein
MRKRWRRVRDMNRLDIDDVKIGNTVTNIRKFDTIALGMV